MQVRGFEKELGAFERTNCKIHGRLFADCQFEDRPSDALDFITKYMNSQLAAEMDKDLAMCHNWGQAQLLETFLGMESVKLHEGEYIDSEVLRWVGYLYRYWTWWLGASSKEIIKEVPAELACGVYIGLHTLDPKQAILTLKRRNKMFAT